MPFAFVTVPFTVMSAPSVSEPLPAIANVASNDGFVFATTPLTTSEDAPFEPAVPTAGSPRMNTVGWLVEVKVTFWPIITSEPSTTLSWPVTTTADSASKSTFLFVTIAFVPEGSVWSPITVMVV